jgi:hypothetical protein
MQASKQTVVAIVKSLSDMRGAVHERRYWCDKVKEQTERSLSFRFYSAEEADKVAAGLTAQLAKQGFDNEIKRTSVAFRLYRGGGEYVRVRALA